MTSPPKAPKIGAWQSPPFSHPPNSTSQAREVGRVAIDGATYHRHLRTVRLLAEDAAATATAGLQQGDIVTLDVPAIGMTGKPCEVLAVQRSISRQAGVEYTLQLAYYEAVA